MPVGPWPTFEACVRANQDKEDPEAYCGRIESRMGVGMWLVADVVFDTDKEAREAERLVREQKLAGLSADIGLVTSKLEVLELDDSGTPTDWLETIVGGEVVGATLLPMPAFGDARIVLNEDGSFTAWVLVEGEKTSDRRMIEPEAITFRDPAPLMFLDKTTDQHAEAVFVGNLSNFRRTEALVAALPFPVDPSLLEDPELASVTRPHFEGDRYLGHGAAWGTCHLAYPGCVTPPESKSDYSIAKWKEVGGTFGVPIYLHPRGDLHAPGHLGLEETRAWYDEHCSLEGLAEVGEDPFGIWVSGAGSEQINGMYLSGDWRRVEEDLELTAFLACRNPAFPLALVASEEQLSLVAAGVVTETEEPDPTLEVLSLIKRELFALREEVSELRISREAELLLSSL